MFDDAVPLLPRRGTIKFHFCRANVFELAIKQRFSSPSQRTTRPRRGVGSFSFFVYSPANWFCGIHAPFHLLRHPSATTTPPPPPPPLALSSSGPLAGVLTEVDRRRRVTGYFGVRKYAECMREGCRRAPAVRTHRDCHRQKSSSVRFATGTRIFADARGAMYPAAARRTAPGTCIEKSLSTG